MAAVSDSSPLPAELPGGTAYVAAWQQAERDGGRIWTNASPEERERLVTAAAVSRRRQQQQAEAAGFASIDAYIDAQLDRTGDATLYRKPKANGVQAISTADSLDFLPPVSASDFPQDPDPVAFDGLIGECVDDIATGTDASLVGLLGSVLAFAGALLPGHAYFHRLQTSSPFVALVGESSIGRKGTAMMRAYDAFSEALGAEWVNRAILDGLASGEGLVSALQWKQSTFPNEPTVGLVFEEEFAQLLAARGREGSTLDPKMRAGFDGGVMSNRRSSDTKTVEPPYWLVALIAITPLELRERLEGGAMTSGSANRWIYLPVVRRDVVPTNDLPRFAPDRSRSLGDARKAALATGRTFPTQVAPSVVRRLAEYADWLPTVSHGLARDLTRRLSVIAFRIALVHALAERGDVGPQHLDRGIALTEYARRGIPWVFGSTIGNRDTDLLYRYLAAGVRLSKSAITRELVRDPIRRQAAIDELLRLDLAMVETTYPEGGGRPRSELVGTSFFHSFQVFDSATPKNVPLLGTLEETPRLSTNGLGKNVESSVEELGRNPQNLEETPSVSASSFCLDFREHQSFHRDIQTDSPWCEACSPRLT